MVRIARDMPPDVSAGSKWPTSSPLGIRPSVRVRAVRGAIFSTLGVCWVRPFSATMCRQRSVDQPPPPPAHVARVNPPGPLPWTPRCILDAYVPNSTAARNR